MAGIAAFIAETEVLLGFVYPKLTTGINETELNRQDAPPRIIWLIPSVGHSPAQKVARSRRRRRSILTRDVAVVAHVWGSDLAELEHLVEDTIAAVHRVAHGSVAFGGEQWLPVAEAHLGMAALLRFTVSGPVLERLFANAEREADTRLTTAKVTQIDADTSTSASGDGAIDWKEP